MHCRGHHGGPLPYLVHCRGHLVILVHCRGHHVIREAACVVNWDMMMAGETPTMHQPSSDLLKKASRAFWSAHHGAPTILVKRRLEDFEGGLEESSRRIALKSPRRFCIDSHEPPSDNCPKLKHRHCSPLPTTLDVMVVNQKLTQGQNPPKWGDSAKT